MLSGDWVAEESSEVCCLAAGSGAALGSVGCCAGSPHAIALRFFTILQQRTSQVLHPRWQQHKGHLTALCTWQALQVDGLHNDMVDNTFASYVSVKLCQGTAFWCRGTPCTRMRTLSPRQRACHWVMVFCLYTG